MVFWAAVSGLAAFILALLMLVQVSSINKTSGADFIHRFSNDFFKPENRNFKTKGRVKVSDIFTINVKNMKVGWLTQENHKSSASTPFHFYK